MIKASYVLFRIALGLTPAYKNLNSVYKAYLENHLPFYQLLNSQDKALFEKRVQLFIDMKTFIPGKGLQKITPDIKALVAGAAIQLTFGYPKVYFRYFKKILVFPDKYFNKLTGHYHKGEVSGRGLIVLSLNNLIHGFADTTDGINLGLHEMAHALHLENIVKNNEFNFLDQKSIRVLQNMAEVEKQKISNGSNPLHRSYGATNFSEFFAVTTELFFEKPNELYAYHPELYQLMARILNFDIINYK